MFNGGGITLLLVQALGAAAYAIWTLVTCWIAWSVIGGLFGGIRVSEEEETQGLDIGCLLYTSPSPRDISGSRMPSSA